MKLKIEPSSNRQYYVRIVASNGRTLAHSETYVDKAGARHCASLIKTEAPGATIEDNA